ncbi:MAG: hypothetical protein PH343_06295 [Nitrospira sp.]|nr:hypothetical protein [Nitrospira sp.]
MEYALFLRKLYNYSRNHLSSEKKIKRLYLSNTAFTLALNPQAEFPVIMEQFFVNTLGARFFLRTPQKEEIDIIHTQETEIIPVEVKIREQVGRDDTAPMFRFLEKNNLQRGLIITLNTGTIFKKDTLTVEALPYWKYWSIAKRLGIL